MRNLFIYCLRSILSLVLVMCMCSDLPVRAQGHLEWMNYATNKAMYGGVHEGKFTAIDSARNIYVLGELSGDGDYNPSSAVANLRSTGSEDIFIARYDSSGNYISAISFEGWASDHITGFAIDNDGNFYICGFWTGFDFDPDPNNSIFPSNQYASGVRGFIAKYSNNGTYVWSRLLVGSWPRCLAITTDNDLIVGGTFFGYVDLNPGAGVAMSTPAFADDIFLTRLDTAGYYQANACFGGNGNDLITDIAISPSGKIFITGSFDGTIDFNPTVSSFLVATSGGRDAFVASYSSTFSLLFAKKVGGVGADEGVGLVVGVNGMVYCTGHYNGTADLDGSAAIFNVTSAGASDIFITVYDTLGVFNFGKSVGGVNSDEVGNIAINNLDNFYITGSFAGSADFDPNGTFIISAASASDLNVFIAGYTSVGSILFAKSIGGSSSDYANDICVVGNSSVIITGLYEGTVDFDPGPATQLRTGPYRNAFFAEYSSGNGSFLLAKEMGKYGNKMVFENGRDVTQDATGNVYTCGMFMDTTDFDIGPSTVNLIQPGVTGTAFVAKYSSSGVFGFAFKLGNSGGTVSALSINSDSSGNLIVLGNFSGTIDFNPGAGVANLTSNSGGVDVYMARYTASGSFISATAVISTVATDEFRDCFVDKNNFVYVLSGLGGAVFGKFTTSGNTVYLKTILGNLLTPYGICSDTSGNAVITGSFGGSADFDPSVATYNLSITTGSESMFLAKYNATGDLVYASATSNSQWIRGQNLIIDSLNQIYLTGQFTGNADLDFGTGSVILSAGTSYCDVFLAKYSSAGSLLYAFDCGNSLHDVCVTDIDLWSNTQVVLTTYFADTVDFDPSGGVSELGATNQHCSAIIRYSTNGNFLEALRPAESNSNNVVYSTYVDPVGEFLMTGYYTYIADFDPSPGSYYLFSSNNSDYFVGKYRECNPISASVITTPSCSGDSSGAVYLSASGSGLSFSWLNLGSTTNVLSAISSGTYTCIITDACYNHDTINVTVPSYAPLVVTESRTDVDCNGNQTGAAVLSVSGGTSPYNYTWSSPNGNDSLLAGVGANTYWCIITDANNCSFVDSVVITEPAQLVISSVVTEPLNCISGDGTIILSLTGGTPGYNYLWSTNDTTPQVTGLHPGNIQCQVTDLNSCSVSYFDTLFPQSGYPTVLLNVAPAIICSSSSSVVISGGSPAGGTWSSAFMIDSLFYANSSGSGTFSVSYTYTDSTGCASTASDSLLVDPCLYSREISSTTFFKAAPNPATNDLIITTEAGGMLQVTNPVGELLKSENIAAGTSVVNVAYLANGMYYFYFKSESGENAIQPIIITR